MKKSELKTGMNIYFQDGSYGTVLLGTDDGDIVASGGDDEGKRVWFPLDDYTDDLSLWGRSKKVIKVTQPYNNASYLQYEFNEGIVWERKPEKTYTIDELISLIKKATQ